MEIRWVEAFIAAAEELHFGRAAERVSMSQSPFSQVIRKIERDVGTPLFTRNTRSVELTAAGHAFLPHARAMLAELQLGREATAAGAGEVYGQVRIGFSGVLNHETLPPLASAVRSRYPAIDLRLIGRSSTADSVRLLRSDALDLAFVGLPVDRSTVAARSIGVERLGALLPATHRLADRKDIAVGELNSEQFVTMPDTSILREQLVAGCVAAGFRPHIVQAVEDPYVVLLLVAAGVGVSLMPESLASVLPTGCRLVPVTDRPAPTLEYGMAWRRGDSSRALRAVLKVADEVLVKASGSPTN